MFGLTTFRRSNDRITALLAENNRLRGERDTARSERDTAIFNRRQIVAQFADADATNRRLMGRNLELGRRLGALGESDPEYAASLERRVARLLLVGARLLAAYAVQKRRADRLQRRLDDACGLDHPAVDAGQHWQSTRSDKPRRADKETTS